MAKYLSFNGTSDYIKAPSMAYNRIVIDLVTYATSGYITDGRDSVSTGYPYLGYLSGNATLSAGALNTLKINGVSSTTLPNNQRQTVDYTFSGSIVTRDYIYIGTRYTLSQFLKMDIYDIKIYSDSTLVAHYDMTTGTVNDQTGNGYNATLTGGTWADNGVSPKAIVFDNFNRPDNATSLGNAVTGQAWTNPLGGGLGISGNQAYITSTSNADSYELIDGDASDCRISLTIGNIGNNFTDIIWRWTDQKNYFFIEGHSVYCWSNSVRTLSADIGSPSLSTGDVVTIDLNGNTTTIYINGVMRATFTSSSNQINTMHGFKLNSTTARIDNFLVADSNTIIYDSFDRADTTTGLGKADTGQVYSDLSTSGGAWQIKSNQLNFVSGTATNPAFSVLDTGASDVTIALDSIVTATNGVSGSIAFRVSDVNNYWLFRSSGGTYQLYKFVNGTATLVGSLNESVFAGTYTYKVVLNGSSITCYVNDVQKLTTTDTFNQTATKYGIRQHVSSSATYDNLTVSKIASASITTPPSPTISSIDHTKISSVTGMNQCHVTFTFDQDVDSWQVEKLGTGEGTGTVVDSGGAVTKGTQITAIIDNTELVNDGAYRINIYGHNANGWTSYQ